MNRRLSTAWQCQLGISTCERGSFFSTLLRTETGVGISLCILVPYSCALHELTFNMEVAMSLR
jgi:hypothetical protein